MGDVKADDAKTPGSDTVTAADTPADAQSGPAIGDRLDKPIQLTLKVRVHGPHGWLSGDRAGMLRFTCYVSLAVTLLAGVWGVIVYQRRRSTFAHQYWISALLLATFLEFMFRMADLAYENSGGEISQ